MNDFSRQEAVFKPNNKPVHIIGCGATGSWIALMLVKMGIQDLRLYDFDKVEAHNLPNQLYTEDDIGEFKVDALKKHLENFKTSELTQIHKRCFRVDEEVCHDEINSGTVFCLVDSMSARQTIIEALQYKYGIDCFIETRMGTDNFRVYCIDVKNPDHVDRYMNTICDDSTTEESACGTSQTITATAQMLASTAVWRYITYCKNNNISDIENNELIVDCNSFYTIQSNFDNTII